MYYILFDKNGDVVNTIVSNDEFLIPYCEEMGYTYELIPKQESEPPPEPEPTAEEDLMEMAVDHELRITMLEIGLEV